MDSSSLKHLILKFVSEGPYLQDFTFCIFWYFWHHTIMFCWNFDWDQKCILGPLLVRCALPYNFLPGQISPAEHSRKSTKGSLQGSPAPTACVITSRRPSWKPLPHVARPASHTHGPYSQSTVLK